MASDVRALFGAFGGVMAVACLEGRMGRVLAAERRRGLGSRIVAEGIRIAREKLGTEVLMLEAQTYARELYEKAGFRQVSEEFLEDGIPHILMRRDDREQEERI